MKKLLALILIVVMAFSLTACGNNAQHDEYVALLVEFRSLALSGAAMAEIRSGGIVDVWRDAIDNRRDFNIALDFFLSADEIVELREDLIEQRTIVTAIYLQLITATPPSGLERATSEASAMFDAFDTLVTLAINPTGSLNSYQTARREAIDSFLRHHRLLGEILNTL